MSMEEGGNPCNYYDQARQSSATQYIQVDEAAAVEEEVRLAFTPAWNGLAVWAS